MLLGSAMLNVSTPPPALQKESMLADSFILEREDRPAGHPTP
jgi:hypothetical protein